MRGSSQSILVQDADKRYWVLKLQDYAHKPNALANELLGALLMRLLEIPCPPFSVLTFSNQLLDNKRISAANDTLRCGIGPHFASRFLPCLTNASVLEIIPRSMDHTVVGLENFAAMFAFDVWAMHADRRQTLFVVREATLNPIFIDNNELFSGVDGWTVSKKQPSQTERLMLRDPHFEEHLSQFVVRMKRIVPEGIDRALSFLPRQWHRRNLSELRVELLYRLSNLEHLVLDALLETRHAQQSDPRLSSWDAASTAYALHASGEHEWSS